MYNSQLIAIAKAALNEEKKRKKEARHELSEKMKVRQDVYLDYASHRLEGRPYKADPDHRETDEVKEWADKEAAIENRWLIRKIEGRSVRGAPEPKDFFKQIFRSPFEKERDYFMEKIVARNITTVRRYAEDPQYAEAVKKVTGFELPAAGSTPPAADQEEEVEEEAAGAQEPAATQGEGKKEEEAADVQYSAAIRKEESSSTRKMTIAEKIAASAAAAAAAKKKNE